MYTRPGRGSTGSATGRDQVIADIRGRAPAESFCPAHATCTLAIWVLAASTMPGVTEHFLTKKFELAAKFELFFKQQREQRNIE